MYTSPPSPRDGAALPQSLVSCGRENVRFWRVKRQHLPGCPTSLNEYARGAEFTDLAFEASYGAGDESDLSDHSDIDGPVREDLDDLSDASADADASGEQA